MIRVTIFISLLVFLGALSADVTAQPLPAPEGRVLLSVKGDITTTNTKDDTAQFDRVMLEMLGMREFTTSTIWTEGEQVFAGVPLKALADRLGIAEGATLRAMAVNDYVIEIPYEDIAEDAAILAMDRNGQPMSRRNKGPIWLMYPFDSDARFRSETYHARSIWQLVSIEVRN